MPMMPPTPEDNLDQITSVMASPLYEMLFSLEALSMPRYDEDLAREAEQQFGEGFREELIALYSPLNHGVILAEFALGWRDHEDMDGFFRWLIGMSDQEFAWYVLGRAAEKKDVPEHPDEKSLAQLVEDQVGSFGNFWYMEFTWAADFQGFRHRLAALWQRYWSKLFAAKVDDYRNVWLTSSREMEEKLRRQGVFKTYTETCDKSELPPALPEGFPYQEIVFIPSCRSPHARGITYYGYGSMHVIFNCRIQQEDRERFKQQRAGLLATFKSLSDETRFRILRQIALNERMANGKWLAAKLMVSPSVVSRHIRQLKDAGLIEEHTEDNRNITYTVNHDKLKRVSEELEAYLLGTL